MGTIVDKFNYSFEAKDLIKDSINNLGGSITSETELKEYAQELDNIYDNLPKTTGEGTNLSLTTLKGKMNIIPKGDTQQETTTGKNLLKSPYTTSQTSTNNITLTIEEDMKIKLTGTANADGGVMATLQNPITLTANTTYTFSLGTGTKQTGWGFYLQNSNNVNLYYIGVSSTSTYVTFTPTQDVVVAKTSLHFTSGTTMNTTIYLQLEQGSSATSYEMFTNGASPNPSYPQDIEVVTGTQEVKVENVNLLKDLRPSTQTLNGVTYTNNENGTFKINGTSSAYTQFVDSDSFTLPKGTYTLSGRSTSVSGATMQLRSPDGYTIITQSNTKTAFTLSEDTQVRFRIVVTANITYSNAEFEPMILSGDVTQNIPTYTPHQEQTQIVSLGDIELCKIGNYQDYLYKSNDKWYKKEYIGKVNLKDISWTYDGTVKRIYGQIGNGFISQASGTELAYLVCTHYTTKPFDTFYGAQTMTGIANGNGSANTSLRNTNYTSLAEYTTEFTNNNEILYYAKTPQDIEITNTNLVQQLENLAKLYSYNGTTNISSSGNLPMILNISALKGES